MNLDHLKNLYGRYQAILDRQQDTPNHAIGEKCIIQEELLSAIPGLIRVCDAYLDAKQDLSMWKYHREERPWSDRSYAECRKYAEELLELIMK